MVTINDLISKKRAIAVIGMGYVGLPLAVELGKKFKVIGFDIQREKIAKLHNNEDPSKELSADELKSTVIEYTYDPSKLKKASFVIVAVPTPIDSAHNPDLTPVKKACETIGKNLSRGSVVVLESTVYPGVTEEIMGPELEKHSGLKQGVDFKLGYSPERINPGDREHALSKIVKVVSGQDAETLDLVSLVYEQVVEPGVYRAASIKVAEAAKVIENTQRDLNIALMNELAIIFDRLGIDSREVFEAAGTKWNFLKFSPGLVGGHCIGVDPYYLTHKAKESGYNAEIILAGRRINDSMGSHVAAKTVKLLIKNEVMINGATVLVLGLTFKENVSDIRNTKVIDIIEELESYGVKVQVCDPLADPVEVMEEYGIELVPYDKTLKADAIILASSHKVFTELTPAKITVLSKIPNRTILVDVKRIFSRQEFENAGITYAGL